MNKNNNPKIPDELLDQLLAGRDPRTALDPDGLIADLKKAQALPVLEEIVAMYAHGISIGDIQRHARDIYGIDISPALVSVVTDAALDEVTYWQIRPLNPSYAIVFFDTVLVNISDGASVKSKTVYLAIGVHASGHRQVLGMWIEQSEGTALWLQVMNEIKARGTQDILIAVVNDMKGCPDAITAVFPNTEIQPCIADLIRRSTRCAPWEKRRSIANELAPVYCANSAGGAAVALEFFGLDNWGRKYPAITQSWRDHWEAVIPFFTLPIEVRRIIYTTNVIESLNACVRRAIRNNGNFGNDQAATKFIWLALHNIAENWTKAPVSWRAAKAQLAIRFGGRFELNNEPSPAHTTADDQP